MSDRTAAALPRDPLDGLVERTKENPFTPLSPEVVAALVAMKGRDLVGFMMLRQDLKLAKCPVGDLDKEMKAVARQIKSAKETSIDAHAPTGPLKSAVEQSEEARRARDAEAKALDERVREIATSPRLLDDLVDLIGRLGVVNERRGILSTYLTASSRLHVDGAVSLLRRGAAAGGKNYLVERVLKLVPPESVVSAVGGSPKSLAYYGGAEDENALKHKLIYIPEAAAIADRAGVENEFTTMLRVLISENRLNYQTVALRDGKEPKTVSIVKHGPIAVLITSARDNIETEMMTRLLVSDADESVGQTRAIIKNSLADHNNAVPKADVDKWIDFQRWLELNGPYDVAVPFAPAIDNAIGELAETPQLRLRRDIVGFLRAIMASAIIHVAQRNRDERGRIVATLDDYAMAHVAFDYDMGSLYALNVPETVKAVVKAIEAATRAARGKDASLDELGVRMTYDDIRAALGINSNNTVALRLREAARLKLIEVWSASESRTSVRRYKVRVSSAELNARQVGGVFPSPEAVRNAILILSRREGVVKTGGEAGEDGEDYRKSGVGAAISTTPTPTSTTFTINSEGDAPSGKIDATPFADGSPPTDAAPKWTGRL